MPRTNRASPRRGMGRGMDFVVLPLSPASRAAYERDLAEIRRDTQQASPESLKRVAGGC